MDILHGDGWGDHIYNYCLIYIDDDIYVLHVVNHHRNVDNDHYLSTLAFVKMKYEANEIDSDWNDWHKHDGNMTQYTFIRWNIWMARLGHDLIFRIKGCLWLVVISYLRLRIVLWVKPQFKKISIFKKIEIAPTKKITCSHNKV